jgi:NodT family efflux transporter outer membrane factor (OMF) lipoprotein
MNTKHIIIAALVSLSLTGCGLYDKYENKVQTPDNVFGSVPEGFSNGDTLLAQTSWREFFTDPLLQQLIDQGLANNTDLNSARIAIKKAEAYLKMARQAYLPSLFFSPQGSLSKFDTYPWSKTYNLQMEVSMDIDVFGSITNKKRAAKAVLLQSQMGEEATRSNLISTIAQQYYYLQLLDLELEILTETDSLWKTSLETQQALWENGQAFSTAVNQQESSWLSVKTQIVDTRRSITATENSLCQLLAITPQHIARSKWGTSVLHHLDKVRENGMNMFDTQFLKIGVSAALLEQRPDVRMANFAMEEAFYNTQAARSAFFPTITLGGSAGWTNSSGVGIVNPGKLLFNIIGSLSQPILARGKLKGNLKIQKLTEEDQQKKYVQTIIDAGNEVNEALADCQAAHEKYGYFRRQVEVLQEAYVGTHELMDNGKASYLEVLTAQESLLSAQLNEATNMYDGAQALIALYIALGGGTK